ncbi:MAG: DUF2188 domain-containing protein [Candidatus Dojkabacteria bacterium]
MDKHKTFQWVFNNGKNWSVYKGGVTISKFKSKEDALREGRSLAIKSIDGAQEDEVQVLVQDADGSIEMLEKYSRTNAKSIL